MAESACVVVDCVVESSCFSREAVSRSSASTRHNYLRFDKGSFSKSPRYTGVERCRCSLRVPLVTDTGAWGAEVYHRSVYFV